MHSLLQRILERMDNNYKESLIELQTTLSKIKNQDNGQMRIDIVTNFVELFGLTINKDRNINTNNDNKTNEEHFIISGELVIEQKDIVSKNFHIVADIIKSYQQNEVETMLSHGKKVFNKLLQGLGIDIEKAIESKTGVETHKTGIYDSNFAIFTLQQILMEDSDSSIGMYILLMRCNTCIFFFFVKNEWFKSTLKPFGDAESLWTEP